MGQKLISDRLVVALIVSLALFMDALDATIINTAIPAMSRSLEVNPVDLKIALISYLVSLAVFIPTSSWFADKFGAKQVFITALCIFTISSFWCGYAQTLSQLVAARAFQGLGGALMLPTGRLIILRTFARHELVDAMNHVVMVVSVGMMLGPVAGGFITDHFSWHWIFWVNIPVGIFAILAAWRWIKETVPKHPRPFDLGGFILFGGGLAALTFSMSELSESSANQQAALGIMGMAVLMLAGFFLHARKQKHTIINLTLFQFRTFQVSVFGNLLTRLSFGGVPFLLPLMLQIGLGYSAQLSGLLMVPIAVGVLTVKYISLRVLRLMGYKRLLMLNTILIGLLLWTYQIINVTTPTYIIALLTFLFGVLISMQFSGMNSLGYSDISPDDQSSATSLVSTMQQISASFGVAVSALLLRYYSSATTENIILTPAIFHETFFALGTLTFFTSFLFLRLHPKDGHQMLTAPAQDKIAVH